MKFNQNFVGYQIYIALKCLPLFFISICIGILLSACTNQTSSHQQDTISETTVQIQTDLIALTHEELTKTSEQAKTKELTNTDELVKSEGLTDKNENLPYSTLTFYPYNDYRIKYPDFKGWISIPGTNIDSPIVQTTDNAHYLNYDYTDSKNYSGAIYMDYKNKGNFYDNHISLYGHYMKNGTMFHDLHFFKEQNFFEENHSIYLTGLREKYRYEIFSVQIVSADHYYLYLNLDNDELNEYAMHFQRESLFKHTLPKLDNLKLLTLVTCTYEFDNARLLIHAYQAESIPFNKP